MYDPAFPDSLRKAVAARRRWVICVVFALCAWIQTGMASAGEVDFDREILPLLSDRCFHCHGQDENHREAELRLDLRDVATAPLPSEAIAIVPGHPEQSELIRRISSSDESEIMPPPEVRKPLSDEERELLRRWIAAGAEYKRHWSFVPPQRPELPAVSQEDWCRNEIDRFVLSRLDQEQLVPSPEAGRTALLRRLSFDLTGLPPTLEEIEDFNNDSAPDAYQRLIHRLLASPHFGERMAMFWLDAARYSDTDGFQQDSTRANWPWRDWVIDAFNKNLPFDQFTREQFAGDLLPDATPRQQLATCFHRNHMTNGEGGRDPEESRIDYIIDRVNTTGTVWLGLTLGCCQCHSHKYDPVTQRDYYQLTAFFNSIDEDGRASSGAKPFLDWKPENVTEVISQAETWLAQQQKRESQVVTAAEPRFQRWLEQQWTATRQGFDAWHVLRAVELESESGTLLSQTAEGDIRASGPDPHHEDYRIIAEFADRWKTVTGIRLEVLPVELKSGMKLSRSETGYFILSDIKLRVRSKRDSQVRDVEISSAIADYSADPGKNGGYGDVKHTLDDDPRNGWATFGKEPDEPRVAQFELAQPLGLAEDEQLVIELQQRALQGRHNINRFRLSTTDQPGKTPHSLETSPLEQLAELQAKNLTDFPDDLRRSLRDRYLAEDTEYLSAHAAVTRAKDHLDEFRKAAGTLKVMVLSERKDPRESHVLIRGVWDQKGDVVEPGVPTAILGWPDGVAKDRAGLAAWLTSRDNPLTARVIVNHLWGLVFGRGLVRTPEDFGLQGERPTHPELLDWLAVELMESGWDLQHVLRIIVSSATYRQTSDTTPALIELDPDNRLLARGARFRLPSWVIRDAALRSSGLLTPTIGGPPVRPYQPPGVWSDITMGRFHYVPNEGPARYRRTVYTFWRRSAAPSFLFDSAKRRVCEVRIPITNTPLQALTLLNDVTMLEASRALALESLNQESADSDRIQEIWKRILSRDPSERELQILARRYESTEKHYREHQTDARHFLGLEANDSPEYLSEQAALSVIATMIFNLDEAMTRQ